MPFALDMAGETEAKLQLLHVLPITEEIAANAAGMPYYDREGAVCAAKNMLEPWCERARKLGLQCTVTIRENAPVAWEIFAVARITRPDRLILGTRSLGKLGRLLLGSVAEQVLRSADLPVFTVGPEAHLAQQSSGRQASVLFATALRMSCHANAALACQLAISYKAKLVILHVLPATSENGRDGSHTLYSTILDELQQLAHKMAVDSCTNVDIKVAHGNPAAEILTEATASQARLIVMGATDYSAFDSITHDRTICQVLARAQCPLLSLHGSTGQRLQNEAEAVARK
jgi:nucleotide-binding universal stress UspA family protein